MTTRIASALLCLLMLASLVAAAEDQAAKDLVGLQGKWSMVSGSRGGAKMPEEMLKSSTRVCKGHEVAVHVAGTLLMKATFTFDATKNPKPIDYDVTDAPNAGKKQL